MSYEPFDPELEMDSDGEWLGDESWDSDPIFSAFEKAYPNWRKEFAHFHDDEDDEELYVLMTEGPSN